MEEVIAGNGRVFKKTLEGNYQEIGGGHISLTGREMANYERYTGVKTERLRDCAKTHPKFTQMMTENAKR